MTSCLALLVYLTLVTSADHAQFGWLNLQAVVTRDSEQDATNGEVTK
jgi:hypothetical protein